MKHSRKKHLNNTLNVNGLNNQLRDRGCLAEFKKNMIQIKVTCAKIQIG